MKVLVTGVTGQLGYDVAKELERRHIEYKGVGSQAILLTFIHGQFKIAIISKKQGREEYPCRNGKESSHW